MQRANYEVLFSAGSPLGDSPWKAASNGVNVRILLPSEKESPLVLYARQLFYQVSLEGGIHHYQV
jgi:phosphatidylserine/phosphatidylglycerophosphate/cardiolipin synthase-like enzyme